MAEQPSPLADAVDTADYHVEQADANMREGYASSGPETLATIGLAHAVLAVAAELRALRLAAPDVARGLAEDVGHSLVTGLAHHQGGGL